MTTNYAMFLSSIVQNVTITHKYKNFDMAYTYLPLDKSPLFIQIEIETKF